MVLRFWFDLQISVTVRKKHTKAGVSGDILHRNNRDLSGRLHQVTEKQQAEEEGGGQKYAGVYIHSGGRRIRD